MQYCVAMLLWISCHSMAYALPKWNFQFFEKKPGFNIVIAAPFAEMRTGPGRGYPVFHVVEKGESLTLIKRRNDWYKGVTPKGETGWIKRQQLTDALSDAGEPLSFAQPSRKDFNNRRLELGTLGGDFSGANALTHYVGYHATRNLSYELKYTRAFGNVSNSQLISGNIVHQTFPEWRFSPFFTLGAGRLYIEPSSDIVQTEERKNTVFTVGGGMFIYLSRRFLIRLEYDKHTALTKRESNEEVNEWKAGFSVFF